MVLARPTASPRPRGRLASLVLWLAASATFAGLPVAPAAAEDADGAEGEDYMSVIDLTFPVEPSKVTFDDWYDAPRSGGRVHQATDIMGSKLLPIHAVSGGVVVRMPLVDDQHGYRLTILGDDGRSYSYVHLNNDTPGTDDGRGSAAQAYAPGVELDGRVERGQHIAYMGDSGNAEGTAAHLHLSIADPDVVDPYGANLRNPYPSLRAAIERGDVPTGGAVAPPASTPPDATTPPPPELDELCETSGAATAGPTFVDVGPGNVHQLAVECLARLEVTEGVGDGRYSPSDQVTRLQMASFTARLLTSAGVALPSTPPDAFDDDAGTVHEHAVNQLVAVGVIRHDTGEVGRDFQGRVAMKRDRMAAWMVRAHELITGAALPAPTTDHFGDDAALHHADINSLADAGIVQGTSAGTYSPRAGVRRDQMGSYLARTLAHAQQA